MRLPTLLLLSCVAGCAGLTLRPRALDEAVEVRDLGLAFTPQGTGELTLRLEVENPTLWDAEVTGADFELWVEGRRYAVGTRAARLALPSEERRTLALSFPLVAVPVEPSPQPRTWRVAVRGGVALAFGDTVRKLPFRAERLLRFAHFRPGTLTPE